MPDASEEEKNQAGIRYASAMSRYSDCTSVMIAAGVTLGVLCLLLPLVSPAFMATPLFAGCSTGLALEMLAVVSTIVGGVMGVMRNDAPLQQEVQAVKDAWVLPPPAIA